MSSRPRITPIRVRGAVLALIFALCGSILFANGPVALVSGVALTADNDTGNGERWGRAGGRTITYTVGATSGYGSLSWGNVMGSAPRLAFDDHFDPSEVLAFDAGSDLAHGIAQWTGSAVLALASGASFTVPTRFTLTVTNGSGSVPMANLAGGANPGIDVLAAGTFTANLLFEMQYIPALGGANQWMPVLDLYDALPTPPGQLPGTGGPVLTSFEWGFYFDNAGMSVEEHDTHITGLIGSVKDDTAFLRIDTVGRLQGVSAGVMSVKEDTAFLRNDTPTQFQSVQSSISALSQLVQRIPTVTIPANLATQNDVNNARTGISDMLKILFGLEPCTMPICDTVVLIPDLATREGIEEVKQEIASLQGALDTIKGTLESTAGVLQVQVVEIDGRENPKLRRWLVRTSVNGSPADAELVRLVAISTKKRMPAATTDATSMAVVTPLLPGLMEVSLHVSQPALNDLAFQFEVRHMVGSALLQASSLVGDTDRR